MIAAQQSTDDLLSQVRPITGPEAVPPPEVSYGWLIGGAVLAAALASLLIWRRWLRTQPTVSPQTEIRHALDQLPAAPTSEALASFDWLCRRWLSVVYRVDGDHETGRASLSRLPKSVQDEWSAVFAQLEPGRFSRRPLTATQWSDLINKVRRLVAVDIAGPATR